ncbi:MAG: hypothetical protein ACD_8C00118G0006 [uncultured bacterium]|nr:MAG: hypothetical protein ACD_8C00118G0006 [uncultured bacterium]
MSLFFKKIFANDTPLSLGKVVASLFSLFLIIIFLSLFSATDQQTIVPAWETTYLHIPLFYFSIFLSFSILLWTLTKKTLFRIWNFLLPLSFLTILPQIISLLVNNDGSVTITHIVTEPQNILPTFLKFLYFSSELGITLNTKIIVFLILFLLSFFIFKNTKSLLRSVLGLLLSYLILFFYSIIPSIVSLPYILSGASESPTEIYSSTLSHGLISTTRQALPLSLITTSQQDFFQSIFMSQIFWLLVVIQLFLIFILPNLKYRKAFLENFPLTRIIYWSIISLIGIYISQKNYTSIDFKNITTLSSFCVIFLLGVLNTLVAICINDKEDIGIDRVSNPNRPLAKGTITENEINKFMLVLVILIIFGLATMNTTTTFFLIFTQMTYYLYSARPLRLKRNFISSSIIIGLASASMAMAGFFFTSINQRISVFPVEAIFIIAISFAILSNMKDIKDYEGDKQEGIQTMPVFFGLENSKKIMAFLYSIIFISIPLLTHTPSMLFFSLLCSLFSTYLFTKKQYREKYIFLVLFFYAGMLFLNSI